VLTFFRGLGNIFPVPMPVPILVVISKLIKKIQRNGRRYSSLS
jgi:hypothetical protein